MVAIALMLRESSSVQPMKVCERRLATYVVVELACLACRIIWIRVTPEEPCARNRKGQDARENGLPHHVHTSMLGEPRVIGAVPKAVPLSL